MLLPPSGIGSVLGDRVVRVNGLLLRLARSVPFFLREVDA